MTAESFKLLSSPSLLLLLCRLPLETVTGEPVYAEASVKGKKKEAVLECALTACRMLDAEGVLRQSSKGKQ